jgi:CheY-like chemotaxis protein
VKILRSVLVVDDNPADSYFVQLLWGPTGRVGTIAVANSGEAALEILRDPARCAELFDGQPVPDLILLDINMPRMDGFEFLQRYQPSTCPPAIILHTSSSDPEDRQRADALGAKGLLIKPPKKQDTGRLADQYGHEVAPE